MFFCLLEHVLIESNNSGSFVYFCKFYDGIILIFYHVRFLFLLGRLINITEIFMRRFVDTKVQLIIIYVFFVNRLPEIVSENLTARIIQIFIRFVGKVFAIAGKFRYHIFRIIKNGLAGCLDYFILWRCFFGSFGIYRIFVNCRWKCLIIENY